MSFLYKRNYAPHSGRQYGLIAEEVAKVFPNLVVNGQDGKPYSVAYRLGATRVRRLAALAHLRTRTLSMPDSEFERIHVRQLGRRVSASNHGQMNSRSELRDLSARLQQVEAAVREMRRAT